ncbi:MAG: matrixin family metalloprotease [Planctomycetota bacterium]
MTPETRKSREFPSSTASNDIAVGRNRSRWRLMAMAVLCAAAATAVVAAVQWKWLQRREAGRPSADPASAAAGAAATAQPAKSPKSANSVDAASAAANNSQQFAGAAGSGAAGSGAAGHTATGAVVSVDGARAERSAVLSAAARKRSPIEALLLAVEAERSLGKQPTDAVGGLVEQSLRDAIDHCSGFALGGHREPIRQFAISSDGQRVVTVSDRVRGWDLARGHGPIPGPKGFREFALPTSPTLAPTLPPSLPPTTVVRLTADGGAIELVTAAGEVWWWEWAAPELPARIVALPGLRGPLRTAIFCDWPSAGSAAAPPPATETAWLATCDALGGVVVWRRGEAEAAERRAELAQGGVGGLALSGNGRFLATAGGVAQVWDLAAANVPLRATLLAPKHFEFQRIAASALGDWVAAVDVADNLFVWRWWDNAADDGDLTAPPVPMSPSNSTTSGTPSLSATGNAGSTPTKPARPVVVDTQPELSEGIGGAVSALVLDPATRWVAVASVDRAVRVFNLAEAMPGRATLSHAAPVRDLALSPTGEWLFSRDDAGSTAIWRMDHEIFDPRINPRPAATLRGMASDSSVSRGAATAGSPSASRFASAADGATGLRIAGGWLASVDGDGQLRGWVLGAGNGAGVGPIALPLDTLPISGGPWKALAWAVSPRGDRVAALIAGAAEATRSIEVWRIDSGRGFVLEQALAVDIAPTVANALAAPGAVELLFSGTGDALALLAAAPVRTVGADSAENGEAASASGSRAPAEGAIGHVSLWRIADPDASTRIPRASDFQLVEPLSDLRFGANWLLGLTPNGRLRIWSRSTDGADDFIERTVATHAPARELRLSPRGQRLALLHDPPSSSNAAAVISAWGPPAEADGAWTQTGSWPCGTASPSFQLGDRWLVVGERTAAGDGLLRGFSVAAGTTGRWDLRFPTPPEFRLSRDGERLLVIAEGMVRYYEMGDAPRQRAAVRIGDGGDVAGAGNSRPWTWSADGRWFAVRSGETLAWWDLDAGESPPRLSAEVLLNDCQRLFFDSHSDFFMALDERGLARVCPTRRGDWVAAARRSAGRNFTFEEWSAAFGRSGEPYRETFAGWGPGGVALRSPTRAAQSRDVQKDTVTVATDENQGKAILRYHVESLPSLANADQAAAIVREAWRAWESVGPIRAVEVSATQRPHVVIRAERLDGPAGAPAHGQLGRPGEGVTLELRFDVEQTWTEDLLRLVATHELGHLLGLEHTATPGQLMSDSVPDGVRTPQAEDIQRLRMLWSP